MPLSCFFSGGFIPASANPIQPLRQPARGGCAAQPASPGCRSRCRRSSSRGFLGEKREFGRVLCARCWCRGPAGEVWPRRRPPRAPRDPRRPQPREPGGERGGGGEGRSTPQKLIPQFPVSGSVLKPSPVARAWSAVFTAVTGIRSFFLNSKWGEKNHNFRQN